MKKCWYRSIKLSKEAKHAKELLLKLCKVLSIVGGRTFSLEMNACNDIYEGHIIDNGKCTVYEDPEVGEDWKYDPNGEEDIGMIFFGGYFSRKKYGKAAISKAWVSLLEDCIGIGELGKEHTLIAHLRMFGPMLDVNFKNIRDFETWLSSKLAELEK